MHCPAVTRRLHPNRIRPQSTRSQVKRLAGSWRCAYLLLIAFAIIFGPDAQLVAQTQNVRPQPTRTATNLSRFGIPFSIRDPDDVYVEVQLYVSKDQGQSWQFYGRQSTAARDFPFQTSGDGIYNFAIRTLDRNRKLHPDGEMFPELEVVVDTVDPELDFRIQPDASGRLVCRWRAEDPNIDANATKLSFRPLLSIDDQNNVWIPVAYKAVTEPQDGIFADQYAFWPETPAREVLVQLIVADRAGNKTVEERQIVVPQMGHRPGNQGSVTRGTRLILPELAMPNSGNEIVDGPPIPVGLQPTAPIATPNQTRPETYGNVVEAQRPNFETPRSDSNSGLPQPLKIAWGNIASTPTVRASGESWPQQNDQRPVIHANPAATTNANRPASENTVPQNIDHESNSQLPSAPLAPLNRNQPDTDLPQTPPKVDALQIGFDDTSRSSDDNATNLRSVVDSTRNVPTLNPSIPRVDSINSRRFQMRYELDRLTPNEVAKVVLWFTADEGKTWTAYGEDPDHVSPFPVELPGPGLYGLTVVFHTVDGLQGRAPARGDEPDYWVRVDLAHPRAKLTAAPYGIGNEAGCLIVEWQAEDELLSDRAITLSYSTFADGPWTNFGLGLENTGRYPWRITREIPEQVYLRLEAVDAAGNVTRNQTKDPIDLSGLIPKARITGVESVR